MYITNPFYSSSPMVPAFNSYTPIFCCGFGCGRLGAVSGTSHWTSATAASLSTTTVHSGIYSLRLNPSSQVSSPTTPSIGASTSVGRGYVYFSTLPSSNAFIFGALNGGGSGTYNFGVGFRRSDSKLYSTLYNGFASAFTFGSTGIAVTTGQWYRLDFKVANSGSTSLVDIQVDGTDASQLSVVNASSNTSFRCGHPAGLSADMFFDDIILSNSDADYPIGNGYVNLFILIADGAHNTGTAGSFIVGSAGANITNSTTDSFKLVDDIPIDDSTADTNDYIAQTNDTGGGSLYVEHLYGTAPLTPKPIESPRAVEVLSEYHQAGTGTGNSTFKLNDQGTEDTILAFNSPGSTNVTATRKHYPNPPSGLGGWAVTPISGNFNDLRHRFGYSTDANPDQYFDAAIIEAEFSGTAPADLFGDNFNDNSINTGLWTATNSTDITITESSSRINFTADSTYSGTLNIASLQSLATYDLTDRQAYTDIVSMELGGVASVSAGTQFFIYKDSNNYVGFTVDQNSMTCAIRNGGTDTAITTLTFGATSITNFLIAHRSFNNTYAFWTLDAGVWKLQGTTAEASWNPTAVSILISTYIYGTNAQNAVTSLDNVRVF